MYIFILKTNKLNIIKKKNAFLNYINLIIKFTWIIYPITADEGQIQCPKGFRLHPILPFFQKKISYPYHEKFIKPSFDTIPCSCRGLLIVQSRPNKETEKYYPNTDLFS